MIVLVDTTIWSLALRRATRVSSEESALVDELRLLIESGRVRIIGPVRQELLSGIREPLQFLRIQTFLRDYADEPLSGDDFEHAAVIHNECRSSGIAGSATDFLLCSVAQRRNWPLYTTDADFRRYASIINLQLHKA